MTYMPRNCPGRVGLGINQWKKRRISGELRIKDDEMVTEDETGDLFTSGQTV